MRGAMLIEHRIGTNVHGPIRLSAEKSSMSIGYLLPTISLPVTDAETELCTRMNPSIRAPKRVKCASSNWSIKN